MFARSEESKITTAYRANTLKAVSLLFVWLIVFFPIIPLMVDTWLNHSDNSHALLVPFVSLYFVWNKRAEVKSVKLEESWLGVVFLIICLLIYLVSFVGGIAFISRLMFVSSLIAIVWSCFGWQMIRSLAFPLLFLFFMIPIPTSVISLVSFPLQLAATQISSELIKACAIPVAREGNMLYFLHTQLEVAEACSGIRSIVSLMMLSVIFAYFSEGKRWRKVVLIISAVPIALVANVLRVTGTGILAHYFGDKVARGFLHDMSGLLVFLFGLGLIFALYRILMLIDSGEKSVG